MSTEMTKCMLVLSGVARRDVVSDVCALFVERERERVPKRRFVANDDVRRRRNVVGTSTNGHSSHFASSLTPTCYREMPNSDSLTIIAISFHGAHPLSLLNVLPISSTLGNVLIRFNGLL